MRRASCFVLRALCFVLGAAYAEGPSTRLDLDSEPQGASVYVDGRDRGVTPTTLFDLKPGHHHLRWRLAGYEDTDRFFVLDNGVPLTRTATLETEKGLLLVKSEPEGCNIAVNGVSVGTTPRLITTLDVKDVHHVTLRKEGYRPSTFEVRFAGRTPIMRNEKMVLDSGTIEVVTEPAGAEVTINGIVRGTTPVKATDVPKGSATVRLRMEGFKEVIRELKVNPGDSQTLSLVMEGLPGTLSLISLPPGARFYVNGTFAGKSPVVLSNQTPGEYDVRAEMEGYGMLNRRVTVKNGASAQEEFRLSNIMGRLEVRTEPPGARVTIDGKVVGVTKSQDPKAERSDILPIENLMEGEHVLVVSREGYADVTRHPKIKSEKTSHQNVRMKRLLVPDVRIVTDGGTLEGMLISNAPDYVTIEVKLGVQRSIPRAEIRKLIFLNQEKK